MKVGEIFILTKRPNGETFSIPEVDFGREMEVTATPSPGRYGRAKFVEGCSADPSECRRNWWFVYEDMMQPVGGPW